MTSSLSCQFDSETQAYDYMWKTKGVAGGLTGRLLYTVPKKMGDGANTVHACMEEC